MCSITVGLSPFHKDEEKLAAARDVLSTMKNLRERRSGDMTTIRLPNGTIISTTSAERLKQYETYARQKLGYNR